MKKKLDTKRLEENEYGYVPDWQISQMAVSTNAKDNQKGHHEHKNIKQQHFTNQK